MASGALSPWTSVNLLKDSSPTYPGGVTSEERRRRRRKGKVTRGRERERRTRGRRRSGEEGKKGEGG